MPQSGMLSDSSNKYYLYSNTYMQYSNYKQLEIYQSAMDLFLSIHPLSLKLPKFEMYELGGQVRRSADGVVSNIVEGYGRKKYKAEFIRFLIFSHSSCLETQNHIEKLMVLYPNHQEEYKKLYGRYDHLGISIFRFISYVEKNWKN
jgi:four helix bundle protein